MYNTFGDFWQSYIRVSRHYQQLSDTIPWMKDPELRRAWSIYRQAKSQISKVLVMGRTCVDEPGRTPAQFGHAITREHHRGLGIITHSDEAEIVKGGAAGNVQNVNVTQGGMIMHFYTANPAWTGYHFLYNDAWLLGGAHGLCTFNLASPRRKDNLWDTAAGRLTVFGREIAFLTSCGFRIRQVGHEGYEVLSRTRDDLATGATFSSLIDAVGAVNSTNVHSLHLPVPAPICTATATMGMTGRTARLAALLGV